MNRRPVLLLIGLLLAVGVRAAVPGAAVTNDLPGGSRAIYAVPAAGWNGDLIVFCHGYQPPTEAPAFANLSFGGVYLPEVAQVLGFAFAAPSYRVSGLAVPTGVEDVRQTVERFARVTGRKPRRTLLVGASEGALITVLSLEKYPALFAGGLAMCGPIGDFTMQTDYVCDFRVLFDYYYPGLMPGTATGVPAEVRANWNDQYEPLLRAAVDADLPKALELLRVARAAFDPAEPETAADTVSGVMWYQAFGTDDVIARLRGSPFGNSFKRYRGSANDNLLNASVSRYRASPVTRRTVQTCQTSGRVQVPLVLMHTTLDEIVPYRHLPLYAAKAQAAQSASHLRVLPIERYGHCNFALPEVLNALAILLAETR